MAHAEKVFSFPWDRDFRYSQAIRVGDLVFVSGQAAIGENAEIVGEGDFMAQAHQVFANLRTVLDAAGSGLDRVVKVGIYVTDMSYFKLQMDPPGSTLLVAEVACDQADPVWKDDAAAREAVLADLERESLIARSEVIASVVYRTAHGQPMYTLGYEDDLKAVLGALEGLENAATAGRQGRFAYVNTHVAMKMGREAADRLAAKTGTR